jgi:hypothetical protein
MIARVRTMKTQWLVPVFGALALVGAVAGDATDPTFDIVENQYQDGFKGATGYLPVFHPTPLTAAEATAARVAVYSTKPDPSNISLEFPGDYQANIVCYGRGFDPRGPYAQPPQAPYLIPGNVAVIAFGDDHIAGGGMYIATSPAGFNDTVGLEGQPQNLRPSVGPIITAENKTGIYEVGIRDGKCYQLRLVSGGPSNAGSNAGPHPEFGNFGANIDGMTWHDGQLYVNDFSGGPEGAGSGPNFAGGRLHKVDPVTGARVALIANLPAEADHQNNAIVFFKGNGTEWLIFEQGTTTNSGTVDGEGLGDIPCYDIQLTNAGKAFFPFTTGYNRRQKNLPTGAPLQQPDGVTVHGTLPCSGATMAIDANVPIAADGSNPSIRLTGFGFRNPYGMKIVPKNVPGIGGALLTSNNDVDVRGQRPLANGGDDFWPFEVDAGLGDVPVRNWGWPNQVNFFSTADPQFGLANNRQVAASTSVFTGNQSRRDPNQPGQAIAGQQPIFVYLGELTGTFTRGGVPVPEDVDVEFVPGISLSTVDISANGFDFSTSKRFGLVNNFFAAGFGNLEFPLGSAPTALVGKDIRRYSVEVTENGAYVGTVMHVFAKNKRQPGGWPNLNTGGFLGPLDLAFDPSGKTMYLADFGAFFTIDSGAVGGFRCDGAACANGAVTYGGATPRSNYFITLEQAAGTSLIWSFNAVNGGVQEESLKSPSQTRPFVAKPKRPGSAPVVMGQRQVVTMTKD